MDIQYTLSEKSSAKECLQYVTFCVIKRKKEYIHLFILLKEKQRINKKLEWLPTENRGEWVPNMGGWKRRRDDSV